MASTNEGGEGRDQTVPGGEEEEDRNIQGIQSHYLRCSSPSFSTASESRFSAISGSDAASIFMEPIHLSSAIAAKKIINEELPPRGVRAESVQESMLETAEQLMVEDLYNRVRDMIDDRSPYNTPCVLDIQRAMVQDRLEAPSNPVDEVWPNIFIAEKSAAVNKARLKRMGITHILNAAHGTGVYTSQNFYGTMNIQYLGLEVDDFTDADISAHFRPTAEFLDEALLTHKGKVLVVSMMGVSRSAVLVASYLMIFQHMTIMEALTALRKKRAINPNEGFLKQLRELNETLLEERDDDDETLSQCSVVDARARARIFGEGADDEDTDKEEEQSVAEVKARSIMMEEEEDGESVMSSIASSAAAAAALRNGSVGGRPGPKNRASARPPEEPAFPEGEGGEDGGDDDGLNSMIRDWQRRNAKYRDDGWWEAQLDSDGEEEEESLADGGPKKTREGAGADVESVTSEEVRAVKERLKRRGRRPPSDAASVSSGTSYSDLWKQRLKEIEEQAAARYRRRREDEEGSESTATEDEEGRRKNIDEEVDSILSDTGSMYNFCQKNKEKMSALERWRVKRIQFGWNKKDREDGEKGSPGEGGDGGGAAEAKTPSFQDVNLTAYQSWKLRQQKRHGEENPEELLEMSRGEDSAAVKRRQRREEILERSKKNLEESQSMCGWETESAVSGGTVPLSVFWAGAGDSGQPGGGGGGDDGASTLSGRSSVISSVSQARSTRSARSAVPVPPVLPVPAVLGPGGEPMVNLASIQNWIANVVSETIKQKQGEMSLPPPSRAGTEVSYGAAASVTSGRGVNDDRASLLSGSSRSWVPPPGRSGAASVLSAGGSSCLSGLSGRGSGLGSTLSAGEKKNRIRTTSVPLFSLFQDQVDMGRLDAMEKEIQSDMREKMATYEKKKIVEDNRRSTLYKKKKGREEEEEEEEERRRREEEFLQEAKKKEKPARTFGLSGRLNLNPVLERDKNTSVDDWLKSVRPPQKNPAEPGPSEDPYDDLDGSASEFAFLGRGASYAADDEEEESYGVASRYGSRLREEGSAEEGESSHDGVRRVQSLSRAGTAESYGDIAAKRKYAHRSRYESREATRSGREEAEEEEEEISAFIAQTRQRIRARAAAEEDEDEVLAAWRAQQESRSQKRSSS